jgi:hypothetical protein
VWVSALAALAFAAGVDTESSAADDVRPRAVVYAYPSSTAAMFALGASGPEPTVYGALGASLRLAGEIGVDTELAAGSLNARDSEAGWMFSVGAGPSIQLTGDEAFRGLFIATRVRFETFQPPFAVHPTPGGVFLPGPSIASAVVGEIDVGYHLRFGRFYIAPLIGFGVGYAYNYVDSTHVRMLSPFTESPQSANVSPQGIVWTVNLNLARIGLAI